MYLIQVLQRIVKEYGHELVQATLCLVETSRFGLLETELLEILAMQPSIPGAKIVDDLAFEGKLPMAKVNLILSLSMTYHLVCNKCNVTGGTVVFCRSLSVLFLLANVLSVFLQFMASYYLPLYFQTFLKASGMYRDVFFFEGYIG